MSIKRFFAKLFGGNPQPTLNELVDRFSVLSSAAYKASKRVANQLNKLGHRGVALLPQVVQAIEFAQASLPISGSGKERLELVRKILNGIYLASEIPNMRFADDWKEWLPIIESNVAELKQSGVLTSIQG